MNKLCVFETSEDKELRNKKLAVKKALEVWLKMEDIDELLVLGKISGDTKTLCPDGLRTHMPGGEFSKFWWTGALEFAKYQLGKKLEDASEVYDIPEEED